MGFATTVPAPPIGAILRPLDSLRSRILRSIAPRVRSLVVDRDRRVAAAVTAMIAVAFVAACAVPIWIIAIGPIVWGIPHILSDFRYLVARPGLHRRPLMLAVIGASVLAGALGLGVRGALAGAIAAIALSNGSLARRAIGVVVFGALLIIAHRAGWFADLVFGHLHNAVGVTLWVLWRRRNTKLFAAPLALIIVTAIAIGLGVAAPLLAATNGLVSPFAGLPYSALATTLSAWGGSIAERLVVLYAFGQSVHYIVWLRAIPEDDRPSSVPRSYAQSYRALAKDLGPIVIWGAALLAIALITLAFVDVGLARNRYMQLGFFHGYLEIACAAFLWSEGRLASGPRASVKASA